MLRYLAMATVLWSALGSIALGEDAVRNLPSDDAIRKILTDRIDVEHRGVGMVVGIVDAHGRRIVAHGALKQGEPRVPDGDTVFEIGSITKAFTGLLLADMVQRGEVRLDDPVTKFLPPDVTLPERNGRQIALIDLATHTSALPRLPNNMKPKDPGNPYADYTVEQMYASLRDVTLTRDIGASYEYSNLGFGLLGHVLARRAGMDYEALLRQRIIDPLRMTNTAITLSPAMMAVRAAGYDAELRPAPYWQLPTLAGAGALQSTTNDLLTLLEAELGFAETPLKAAMAAQLVPRRPMAGRATVALGWHIAPAKTGDIIWHNGGTGGFRTFIGFDPKARTGVVVLTNAATVAGGDDIGMHLLTGAPLLPAPKKYDVIAVDTQTLERYVGRYQLHPQIVVTVTRRDDHLFAQLTDQPELEIFPFESDKFFWKPVDAQVTFQAEPGKSATGLTLHQHGRDMPAPRISP